jgi:hypothetical protein
MNLRNYGSVLLMLGLLFLPTTGAASASGRPTGSPTAAQTTPGSRHPLAPQTCVPPSEGLVSWWSGDGTAQDNWDGNDGTLQNGATTARGQVAQAFRFDGQNDYVQIPAAENLVVTNVLTLDAWIYPTGPGSAGVGGNILRKEGEYVLGRAADGHIRWAIAGESPGWIWVDTLYTASLNQWTHVALVFDNGIIRTYANGVMVHLLTGSGLIGDAVPGDNNVRIGSRNGASEFFQGLIDEVDIFHRVLSDAEIQSLYAAGNLRRSSALAKKGHIGYTNLPTASCWVAKRAILARPGT